MAKGNKGKAKESGGSGYWDASIYTKINTAISILLFLGGVFYGLFRFVSTVYENQKVTVGLVKTLNKQQELYGKNNSSNRQIHENHKEKIIKIEAKLESLKTR